MVKNLSDRTYLHRKKQLLIFVSHEKFLLPCGSFNGNVFLNNNI